MIRILYGDSSQLPFPDNYFDCLVTDPPYGYGFMGKDWDRAVVPAATWKEVLRVLKPGAFGFVMSAPRQDVLARMIVNLQEAGFETGFSFISWCYATGFPKSFRINHNPKFCQCALTEPGGENKDPDLKPADHSDTEDVLGCSGRSQADEQHSTHRFSGSQGDCQPSSHCDGGQPLPVSEDDQAFLRPPGCAPGRSRFVSPEGGPDCGPSHNLSPVQCSDRLSSPGSSHPCLFQSDAVSRKELSKEGPGGDSIQTDTATQERRILDRVSRSWPYEYCNTCGKPIANGFYAGFQPKPAHEVILVVMKPLTEKNYSEQAYKNGHGGTWLEAGRIPIKGEAGGVWGSSNEACKPTFCDSESVHEYRSSQHPQGRFPANLLVSDDVLDDGRVTKSGQNNVRRQPGKFVEHHLGGEGLTQVSHADTGTFSRYFDLDCWTKENCPSLPDIEPAYSSAYTFLSLATSLLGRIRSRQGYFGLIHDLYAQSCDLSGPVDCDTVLSHSRLSTFLSLDVPVILRRMSKLLARYASDNSLHSSLLSNAPLCADRLNELRGFLDDYQSDSRLCDAQLHLAEGISPEYLPLQAGVHTHILENLLRDAQGDKPEDSAHRNLTLAWLLSVYRLIHYLQEIAVEVKGEFDLEALPESAHKTFPFLIVPKASKSEKNLGCGALEKKRGQYRPNDNPDENSLKTRLHGSIARKNSHPTVKPIKLMSYLIAIGSRPGDIILDPFMGSGTTLVAAKAMGRRAVGVDNDPEYIRVAEARVKAAQIGLF